MTPEFDEFVRVRSAGLLRLAYALTRDHALAEDLLQTALARSWSVWSRIDGDPEPYVRRAMVNTFNSWWRRRWNGERPVESVPEVRSASPQSAVDDRDEVWQALLRLPRQQRAVIVLRYFEDMTEAQIAEVMSISAGSVKHYASKGLAKLRLDPSLLATAEFAPVPGTERVAAVKARIRHRRAVRTAVLFIAALVGVVSLLLVRPPKQAPVEPAPTPSASAAFGSPYFDGKKVVGALPWTDFSGPVTFSWTPITTKFVYIYLNCEVAGANSEDFEVQISLANGKFATTETCEDYGQENSGPKRQRHFFLGLDLADLMGARTGVPLTATIQFRAKATPAGPSPRMRMSAELAQSTGWENYFFPAPPAVLPHIDTVWPLWPGALRISSGGPATLRIPWQGMLQVNFVSASPSRLTIKVNGTALEFPAYNWDYAELGVTQTMEWPRNLPGPSAGELVTVEVEADVRSGDWHVDFLGTA